MERTSAKAAIKALHGARVWVEGWHRPNRAQLPRLTAWPGMGMRAVRVERTTAPCAHRQKPDHPGILMPPPLRPRLEWQGRSVRQ